jgi:hypothetical protein
LLRDLLLRLHRGDSLDNQKLRRAAEEAFGGTRAQGIYTPRDAYDALEAAVNQLLLENLAAPLLSIPAEALAELRKLLARLPTQCDRTTEQTELQQFSTPPTHAFLVAHLADLRKDDTVLEPSAGTGSLAAWPLAIGARVIANEINPRRRALLRMALGIEAYGFDAEMIDDLLPAEVVPDVVLMNPPFSATGGRVQQNHPRYGVRHIESALQRLKPGGRLVAIAGEAVSFHRATFTEWWQGVANAYTVCANFGISGKEYQKYGTNAFVQVLVIDKTGPTSGGTWQEQLDAICWGRAESLEEAWEALERVPRRGIAPVEHLVAQSSEPSHTGRQTGSLFVPYVPGKLRGGAEHPAIIVESASMAAVMPPNITYRPHLPQAIVSEGRLSNIQMERVIYAGQRHEQRLPDGARGGFYVGDGTGVGKGRVLAAIILDNWFQKRRRALWLSVNNDLLESTRRDLNDLGARIPLARINDYPADGEIALPEGVLFSSYGSLIAESKKGARRLDQIRRWLGLEPVIIFDEAHKAKNALASGRGDPTQTGQAVIDLQDPKHNPEYRVVYSSATGATDVRNMAYMTRLGLWGPGTSFFGGFTEFLSEIESGGVGAMEMVSRDMKSLGMYLSGSISFGTDPRSGKAVEYRERVHTLTREQRTMYDAAAAAWRIILQDIDRALAITNASPRARAQALNKFWGDHQRFFRQVICAFKVPSVLDEAESALRNDKSAVISLVGTGEARTREQVARTTAEGGNLEDLDFSPREIIAGMIERGFPTTLYQDKTDPVSKKIIQVPATNEAGEIVQSKRALELKRRLLDSLSALHLPENPLDQLVNHFGESNVSEITGRTRRLIRDPRTGKVEYKKRAPEGVPMQRVNVHAMEQFHKGRCRVAIISDAGSIGISLHASNRSPNRQRRVHVTHELGWSADKEMQRFGRTHRSDQAVPPEYVLLATELGGEKRFSSTIARRLGSLGALTKGDRGAADNADWARYNFETQEGRAALGLMYRLIQQGGEVPGLANPKQTLREIGLLVMRDGAEVVRKEDEHNVPRFLNRILALQVEEQNALFHYFADLFDQTVRHAKANGTFDEGVTDIRALSIRIAKAQLVHLDQVTGAETVLYTLEVDRPSAKISFEQADRVRAGNGGAFLEHQTRGTFILALPSGRHTDPKDGTTYATFSVWKPEGARLQYVHQQRLSDKYRPVAPERAQHWWSRQHKLAPDVKTDEVHIIAGAIIPLWQRLKSKGDAKLRVARVSTEDGQRIVGVEIARNRVGAVLRSLGLGRFTTDPETIFQAVLNEGDEIELAGNLKLKQSTVHGEQALELVCHEPQRFKEFREMGLINEQIQWKQRFFVPSDAAKGIPMLKELLSRYPALAEEGNAEAAVLPFPSQEVKVVDVEVWIVAPEEAVESAAQLLESSTISDPAAHKRDGEFSATDCPLSIGGEGPPLSVLLEHSAGLQRNARRKLKPIVEEQGVLFVLS